MRIALKNMPQPSSHDGGTCVGSLDDEPLIYRARVPSAGGREYEHAEIADALRDAVDECAERLWGSEWSGPLSVATGLNRRSCSKDRVWRYGLPAWVLRFLGEAAAQAFPRAVGDLMVGMARVHDDDRNLVGTTMPQRRRLSRDELLDAVQGRVLQAADMLVAMRYERERALNRHRNDVRDDTES